MVLNERYRHCPLSCPRGFQRHSLQLHFNLSNNSFSASTRVDKNHNLFLYAYLNFWYFYILELKSKTDADNTFLIKETKFEKWEKKEKILKIFEKISLWTFGVFGLGLLSVWLVSSGFSSIVPTRMLSSLGHIRLMAPLVIHHVMVTCKERAEIDDGNL